MAILAGGKTLGIAPKSGLYLFKVNADLKGDKGELLDETTPGAYEDVNNKILSYIRANPGRKAVVSLSQGIQIIGDPSDDGFKRVFDTFITELDSLGVTLVIPTGNFALEGETTADTIPQCLGTPNNNVITIGGLNYDGTLWIPSEGTFGSITAYNLASDLTMMGSAGNIIPTNKDNPGTSGVSPITAATIAVLLGIKPEDRVGHYNDINIIYDECGNRPSATATKAYFKRLTFQRSQDILQKGSHKLPYKMPSHLNAVYNGARGPPIIAC